MPQRARMCLPGWHYHIVQCGNHRDACFVGPESCRCNLQLWIAIAKRYGVTVYASGLMTNPVHLLVTPELADSIPQATR